MKSELRLVRLVRTMSLRRAQSSTPSIATLALWPGAGMRRSAPFFAQTWPWCMDQGCGRNAPYPVLGSCDAGGLRASQLQHAVQDLDRHVHLSRPTLIRTRAQPVADHPFEAADRCLGQRTAVVAGGLLPAHAAVLGDELQVAVEHRDHRCLCAP